MEEIKDIEDTKAIAGSPEEATHYHGAVEPIELMQSILTPEEFKGFLKEMLSSMLLEQAGN